MTQAPLPMTTEYSPEERKILLRTAHEAIRAKLEQRSFDVTAPSDHLAEKRGAFTTLQVDNKLRGCIGFVEPILPLFTTVCETAEAAAFDDPRFRPLVQDELPRLRIEISVMSPLVPISPEDVQIGVHGLMISKDGRRGLLLPQVSTEWGWDRETFLQQTCFKAGLPGDAWKMGAVIQAFTAEVFGEGEPGSSLR